MAAYRSVYLESPQGRYHALQSESLPARLLMLHANGFNGGTYLPLLQRIAPEGDWVAPDFRGHGASFTPRRLRNWNAFVDDVLTWKDAGWFEKPVVMGHSFGGVTAIQTEAAAPGTFRAIVLLDPVVFHPRMLPVLSLAVFPFMARRVPIVKGAMARRMEFPSREAIVASYARKRTFAAWQREFLEAYVEWGTREIDDGVRLSCDKRIEARIFSTWPLLFWTRLRRVRCPVLILRGETSDAFSRDTARLLARRLPTARLIEIPQSGHFLPMEQPQAVVEEVQRFFRELDPAA